MYDLDDSCFGAKYLADTGRVDGSKLCIDGGSAGGYTTLAALTFRDVFKAGTGNHWQQHVCSFIINPVLLMFKEHMR